MLGYLTFDMIHDTYQEAFLYVPTFENVSRMDLSWLRFTGCPIGECQEFLTICDPNEYSLWKPLLETVCIAHDSLLKHEISSVNKERWEGVASRTYCGSLQIGLECGVRSFNGHNDVRFIEDNFPGADDSCVALRARKLSYYL